MSLNVIFAADPSSCRSIRFFGTAYVESMEPVRRLVLPVSERNSRAVIAAVLFQRLVVVSTKDTLLEPCAPLIDVATLSFDPSEKFVI